MNLNAMRVSRGGEWPDGYVFPQSSGMEVWSPVKVMGPTPIERVWIMDSDWAHAMIITRDSDGETFLLGLGRHWNKGTIYPKMRMWLAGSRGNMVSGVSYDCTFTIIRPHELDFEKYIALLGSGELEAYENREGEILYTCLRPDFYFPEKRTAFFSGDLKHLEMDPYSELLDTMFLFKDILFKDILGWEKIDNKQQT